MNINQKRKYRKVFIILVIIFLWVATGKIFVKEREIIEVVPEMSKVSIYTSNAGSHPVDIEIPITTEALKIINFKSERAGRVVEVKDVEGEVQNKNTLLVGLDIDDTKKTLESAKANLEKAKLNLDVARQLNKEGYRTKLELSSSEADYRVALQGFETARIQYQQSFIELPYKVYVDEILVEDGDYISQGDIVARVMDLSKVNVFGYITEKNINDVKKTMKSSVRLANGRVFDAEINFVSRFSDSNIHTYKVGALIESNYDIPHGMSGKMTITSYKNNTHLLSFSSLFLGSDGIMGVKALDENDKVIFLPFENYTQTRKGVVVEGLPNNIRVIVSGQALASEGSEVDFIEVKSPFIKDLQE